MELETRILGVAIILTGSMCLACIDLAIFQYIIAEPTEYKQQISKKRRYIFGILYCGLLYLTYLGMVFESITVWWKQ